MTELLIWIMKYISTGYFDDYILEVIEELPDEEKIKLFSNENILRKLDTIVDYEYMARLFSETPSEIQEIIWNNIHCQKLLLGIDASSDQMLDAMIKSGKMSNYYTENKIQAFTLLLITVKSPEILKKLPSNPYFQMFILLSGKIPELFYERVDVELTFQQIVVSDMYKSLDIETRRKWIEKINYNYPKVLLPPDIKDLFMPTETYSIFFYYGYGKTLAAMLSAKINQLGERGLTLDIDYQTFKLLNIFEINILVSDTTGVVNKEVINEYLSNLVDEWLADGSIYNGEHLDIIYLSSTLHITIFKMFIEKTVGNPDYESKTLAYLFDILFPDAEGEYNEEEKNELKLLLKNALVNALDNTIIDLFVNVNALKSIFFCRFGLATELGFYLSGISFQQLLRVNIKHVNKIFSLLSKLDEFDSVAYFKAIAIKMYLVFGLDKSIELLSGNYPINKVFLDIVNKLDVSRVEFKKEGKKYLPIIHEEFYRFMFVANNIRVLFDKYSPLSTLWYCLYNNFDSIKSQCGKHISLAQVEEILPIQFGKQHDILERKLPPNCYRLKDILHRVIVKAGSDSNPPKSSEEICNLVVDIYTKQVKRVKSTIPYVSGKLSNGWSYKILEHDSVLAYVLGIYANCCFRINGIGHKHLLHALLCENGGILLIVNPNGIIAGFSPLKRNGELLIANSIEKIDISIEGERPMINAFVSGIKKICQISKKCESSGYLKVATIGTKSACKPQGIPWPDNISTPTILEKNDPIYADTDSYHKELTVIYSEDNIDLAKLQYGEVNQKYFGARNEVLFCVIDGTNMLLQRQMLRMIEGIRYTKWLDFSGDKAKFQSLFLASGSILYCNNDWFVIVRHDGSIYYECLDDDPRARVEMEQVLSCVKNNTSTTRIDIFKPLILN